MVLLLRHPLDIDYEITHIYVFIVLNGTATQRQNSDVWQQNESPPIKAVDGNQKICSYVGFTTGVAWWKLDLGKVAYIESIIAYSQPALDFLTDFIVTIGNNPTDPQSNQACLPMDGSLIQTTCLNKHYRGRYVFVYKILKKPTALSICEIIIYGSYTF